MAVLEQMQCLIHSSTHTWTLLPFDKFETQDGLPVAAVSAMGGCEELYNHITLQGTALNRAHHWVLQWMALHPGFGFAGALSPHGCN